MLFRMQVSMAATVSDPILIMPFASDAFGMNFNKIFVQNLLYLHAHLPNSSTPKQMLHSINTEALQSNKI